MKNGPALFGTAKKKEKSTGNNNEKKKELKKNRTQNLLYRYTDYQHSDRDNTREAFVKVNAYRGRHVPGPYKINSIRRQTMNRAGIQTILVQLIIEPLVRSQTRVHENSLQNEFTRRRAPECWRRVAAKEREREVGKEIANHANEDTKERRASR